MASRPLIQAFVFLSLVLGAAAAYAAGLINPHVEPAQCGSCHTRVPTDEEAAQGKYLLLKEGIDETCEICHPYTCCAVGSLHEKEHNHPSNINRWDTTKFRRPKTLPLFDGYITCDTCHFHRVPKENSYKLVRIAVVTQTLHDWAGLCRDCHSDY